MKINTVNHHAELVQDQIEYRNGKMMYHPDFHTEHGKPLTDEEKEYLCYYWGFDSVRSLSFALGRTECSLRDRVYNLKRQGLFDYYKGRYSRKLRQWEATEG